MNIKEFYRKLSQDLQILSGTSINERLRVIRVIDQLNEDDTAEGIERYALVYSIGDGDIIYEIYKNHDEHHKVMKIVPRKDGKVNGQVTFFEDIRWYSSEISDYKERIELQFMEYVDDVHIDSEIFENILSSDYKEQHDWQNSYDVIMNSFGDFQKHAREEHKRYIVDIFGQEDTYNFLFK